MNKKVIVIDGVRYVQEVVEPWTPKFHLIPDKRFDEMKVTQKFLAYVAEHEKRGWKADWKDRDQRKWAVSYDWDKGLWDHYCETRDIQVAGTVYMSERCAEALCVDLNSGRVTV